MDEEFQKRIQQASARFRSGESDIEEVESPAGLLRLVRDPDHPEGFRVEAETEGAPVSISFRAFQPSAARPDDYPPDVPFLEHCAVMVNQTINTVTWMDPSEPEDSFERACRECINSGWEDIELHPVIAGSGGQRQAEFKRKGRERTLLLNVRDGHASLALMDRQLDDGSPSHANES